MCILKKKYRCRNNPEESVFLELRRGGGSSNPMVYIKNNTSVTITDIELDADNGQCRRSISHIDKGQDYYGNVDILFSPNLHLKLYCQGVDLDVYKARKRSKLCNGRDCSMGAQKSDWLEETIIESYQLDYNHERVSVYCTDAEVRTRFSRDSKLSSV